METQIYLDRNTAVECLANLFRAGLTKAFRERTNVCCDNHSLFFSLAKEDFGLSLTFQRCLGIHRKKHSWIKDGRF